MTTSTKNILRAASAVLIIAAIFYGAFFRTKAYRESRIALGPVSVEIILAARTNGGAREAMDAAFAEITRINDLMSAHMTKSDIGRLNNSNGEEVEVSPETAEVLRRAIEISELTGGAFDVTAGTIIRLWKDAIKSGALPEPAKLEEARALTGYRGIIINGNRVRFAKPGMSVDLGGIAKGYAVDRAVVVLKAHGIRQALVDAGGDGFALGTAPNGKPWMLGIQDPDSEKDEAVQGRRLALVDRGYATSGDYRQFTVINGERYSHIVDPRTGATAKKSASVTVVAPDATTADAMATAISVLGESESLKVLKKMPGVECLIITRGEAGKIFASSPSMSKYLAK